MMPSSKNRRRVEVPIYMHDRLVEIAASEDRTVANVLHELLFSSLFTYRPTWAPSKHLDTFNARARGALDLAREEAVALGHDYIGTEHLFLGLLCDEDSIAAQALTALGLTLAQARTEVEARIGRGQTLVGDTLDYAPRARKVLGLAMDEAHHLDSGYVRTEHILLGIVRDGGGIAADILDTAGVLGKVRVETLARLGQRAIQANIDS